MLALMRLILEGMHIQYKDRSVMRFYSRKRDVIIDSPQRYVEMIDAEHNQIYDRTNSFLSFVDGKANGS